MLILSCTSYHQQFLEKDAILSKNRHMAVLPFYNLTAYPHAGRIVSDLVLTELYAMTDFRLMDQTKVMSLLNKDDEDMDTLMNRTAAIKIGKMLKVDSVIYGSVTEFRYKRSLNEVPVASISIRLLDINTNRILWAGSKSAVGGKCWFCDDALTRLAQSVVHDLVKSIECK
ncbi:MAG: lipoprotein [Candidatus Magnetoglobus multicellularis str. Araruama]|uniref:Lipoprotein n=1 Tax=Candidatus Magnetoglobus multicellularis str. Araruama TaxID=890399 RepID=A0A1V1PHS9_9BACT|nr:MAG: lipoprotein [Candidatus Magnetoglobus multicellularis str. Araruama]